MRRTMVLLVCAVAIGVPAYGKCKPDPGPDKPVVCIDKANNADPMTVKVWTGEKLQFHFSGGRHKRTLDFDPGLVHGFSEGLYNAYATGDSVAQETKGEYRIKSGSKAADPIIIIEPVDSLHPHHHSMHKD
jgi:hypothetical protein